MKFKIQRTEKNETNERGERVREKTLELSVRREKREPEEGGKDRPSR